MSIPRVAVALSLLGAAAVGAAAAEKVEYEGQMFFGFRPEGNPPPPHLRVMKMDGKVRRYTLRFCDYPEHTTHVFDCAGRILIRFQSIANHPSDRSLVFIPPLAPGLVAMYDPTATATLTEAQRVRIVDLFHLCRAYYFQKAGEKLPRVADVPDSVRR